MHDSLGKSQTSSCAIDPARAQTLHATLGLNGPAPVAGDPLAHFWHQIYFWNAQKLEKLGRDGHPAIGDFIPDFGLPRRMWAGGELQFHNPISIGTPATKTTTISKVEQKNGRTGPLVFVTLRHDIHQSGTLCVTENQDLVYRQDIDLTAAKPTPPIARTDEIHAINHDFTSTELFRYSALTMNGHRIHYDENYARDIEGYGGLVTHGPLLAQYLMMLAERQLGPLKTFKFRATSAMMHNEVATFCINGNDLWVRAPDGRKAMRATAFST